MRSRAAVVPDDDHLERYLEYPRRAHPRMKQVFIDLMLEGSVEHLEHDLPSICVFRGTGVSPTPTDRAWHGGQRNVRDGHGHDPACTRPFAPRPRTGRPGLLRVGRDLLRRLVGEDEDCPSASATTGRASWTDRRGPQLSEAVRCVNCGESHAQIPPLSTPRPLRAMVIR